MRRRKWFVDASLLVAIVALPCVLEGQVLTTAETVGKSNQAVMVTENHLFTNGADLNIAYAQYVRGMRPYFDFYGSVGETTIFGGNQTFVGVGGNLHLFTAKKIGTSLFTIASIPLNRQRQASTVLLNSAIVVSRPISVKWSLYSGVNGLFPIGARARGIFTPTSDQFNAPIGAAFLGKKWSFFFEGDVGPLKAVGVGVGRSL